MLHMRLRSARKAKGLSQVEAAKALGTWQGFISALELGNKHPSIEMLGKLANLYGVSKSELLGELDDYRPSADCLPIETETPPGLRDLARDQVLLESLKIKAEEWDALMSLKLPRPPDKAGYVQLLATIRGVTRA